MEQKFDLIGCKNVFVSDLDLIFIIYLFYYFYIACNEKYSKQVYGSETQCHPLRKQAHEINADFFSYVKTENFIGNCFYICLIFAQNIDCGNTLEPPRRGGSNEYPQSMFWSKNKKNRSTPAYPSFAIRKWGSMGY